MISRKLILFALPFLLLANPISANSSVYDDRLYSCFVSSDMLEWERVMVDLEKEFETTKSVKVEFQLLHAQYGFVGFLLGSNRTSLGEEYIAKADKHIANLLKSNPKWVEVMALQAAVLAYKISLSPYKAPFLGPKSINLIADALELEPNNMYALIEKGNSKHYAPSYVGGSPAEAIVNYQKAITNIKASSKTKTWWYLNTLTQLALAAEKAKNYTLASKTYKEILSIEPNFKWVKDELYPKFLEKITKG
ncbi:hypothetical protein CYCD_27510 [Tenuifilaceae bacterium CYCD]|nr:hypothetical protein CYCD_27510 [Tenuifilaceae bacterium CYCD]